MSNIYNLLDEHLIKEFGPGPLTEMAESRKKALLELNHLEEEYFNHLCKCIIYENITNDFNHWCDEIAQKLYNAGKLKLKPDNKKLESKYYESEFLLSSGDSPEEFKPHIERAFKQISKRYPKSTLTPILIEKIFRAFKELSDYFAPILSEDQIYEKEWYKKALINKLKTLTN